MHRAPESFLVVMAVATSACVNQPAAYRASPPVAYGRPPPMGYAPAPAPPAYAGTPGMAFSPQAAPVADPSRYLGAALTMWGANLPGAAPQAAPPPAGYGQPVAAAAPGAAPSWPGGVPTTIPWSSLPALPGFGVPGSPAAPQPAPGWGAPSIPGGGGRPAAWEQLEQEVFVETNARRARGAVCGSTTFPPAAPLVIDPSLQKMAREHSLDMATRNYFEHATPEGQGPGPRGRAAGYNGVFTGENIAGQVRTAVEVVDLWMSSTGHCHNIMDGRYKNFGAGYAENASSSLQRYWTQNFGP